jgi:integrase
LRLEERGISRLSDVTRADLEWFATRVLEADNGTARKAGLLRSVTRLWAYATDLPSEDALIIPPWVDEPLSDFLPSSSGAPENATPVIHPSTMAPLLWWAQRMLELADDIYAASHHWQLLLEAVPDGYTSHRQASELLTSLADAGFTPFPERPNKPGFIDLQYLAAISRTGVSPRSLTSALQSARARGVAFESDSSVPTPLDSPITRTVDGKPWCDVINKNDLPRLQQAVIGAALVVVGYLTGMRPHEVLALRRGCCTRERVDATTVRYTVAGRKFKRANKSGRSHVGVERSWTTIAPVAQAITTLERLRPGDGEPLLFPTSTDDTKSLSTKQAVGCIAVLVDVANELARGLDLSSAYRIPSDPAGAITLRRFRRTLAWHIRRLPHGAVALAIQYGHLSVSQGEGYAGLTADGFAALMDEEEVAALVENVEQARRDLMDGAGVSGPAAKRLIELTSRGVGFDGAFLTKSDIRRIKANRSIKLYDNPQGYLACMFNPETSLCRSERASTTMREPKLDRCSPNCPNIARTDRHIAALEAEVERLRVEADSPLTPRPLALRLGVRADALKAIAQNHETTAITLTSDVSEDNV